MDQNLKKVNAYDNYEGISCISEEFLSSQQLKESDFVIRGISFWNAIKMTGGYILIQETCYCILIFGSCGDIYYVWFHYSALDRHLELDLIQQTNTQAAKVSQVKPLYTKLRSQGYTTYMQLPNSLILGSSSPIQPRSTILKIFLTKQHTLTCMKVEQHKMDPGAA